VDSVTSAAWAEWGFPAVAVALAALAYLSAWLMARNFDRKYGPDAGKR
jgi:superfamily II helicase